MKENFKDLLAIIICALVVISIALGTYMHGGLWALLIHLVTLIIFLSMVWAFFRIGMMSSRKK